MSDSCRFLVRRLTELFYHRDYVSDSHVAVMRRSLGKTSGTGQAQQSANHPFSFYTIASVFSSVIVAFLSTKLRRCILPPFTPSFKKALEVPLRKEDHGKACEKGLKDFD